MSGQTNMKGEIIQGLQWIISIQEKEAEGMTPEERYRCGVLDRIRDKKFELQKMLK
jgi:hypothetical protein